MHHRSPGESTSTPDPQAASMRRRGRFLNLVVSWCLIWTQMLVAGSSAGSLFPTRLPGRFPPPLYPQHDANDHLVPHPHRHPHHHHHGRHSQHLVRSTRDTPTDWESLPLLAPSHQELQLEHAAVSPQHLVTVYLAVDVRRLNISLLRWFQEGVAAALGVSPPHVHINQLNDEKNSIELFVSSDRPGVSEPRPAEEVIQSLNVRVLHRHLRHFGITEVSTEKNVLQGRQKDVVWTREGFFTIVLFFIVFIIVITCFMVLYRMKEKVPISKRQLKAPPPELRQSPKIPPGSTHRSKGAKVVTSGSMVQADLPPAVATPILQQSHPLPPPFSHPPIPSPVISSENHTPPVARATVNNELKPCPSPFRMKPVAGLQERRGSNVSLVLDMSALGSVEPLSVAVVTPREAASREFLLMARRLLTRQQLRDIINNTRKLQSEFAEIPMNFIDPKQLDVPNHSSKNRYRTILPNPHSRVILKWKSNDMLSSYINANYIRGYRGESKVFIATQGPMVNTVNDFWQMAWQEEAPVIVMITKLKEKNEVLRQLRIKHKKSTAYHAESQGTLERFHQTLKSLLRTYCIELGKDWEEGLSWLMLAAREVTQESTGFSPNELVFGHTVKGPLAALVADWRDPEPPKYLIDYVNGFMQAVWNLSKKQKQGTRASIIYLLPLCDIFYQLYLTNKPTSTPTHLHTCQH